MKKLILLVTIFSLAGSVSAQQQGDTTKRQIKTKEKKAQVKAPEKDKQQKITVNEEGTKPMDNKGKNTRSGNSSGNNSGNTNTGGKEKKKKKSDFLFED